MIYLVTCFFIACLVVCLIYRNEIKNQISSPTEAPTPDLHATVPAEPPSVSLIQWDEAYRDRVRQLQASKRAKFQHTAKIEASPDPVFGEYVYTHALVTLNRWTGTVALFVTVLTLILGPLAAAQIASKRGADAGWEFFLNALAVAGTCAAAGLTAYVVAELLTMAVRVVSVLKSIDAKLGSGPLATAVPPKSDVNPDEPPKA